MFLMKNKIVLLKLAFIHDMDCVFNYVEKKIGYKNSAKQCDLTIKLICLFSARGLANAIDASDLATPQAFLELYTVLMIVYLCLSYKEKQKIARGPVLCLYERYERILYYINLLVFLYLANSSAYSLVVENEASFSMFALYTSFNSLNKRYKEGVNPITQENRAFYDKVKSKSDVKHYW